MSIIIRGNDVVPPPSYNIPCDTVSNVSLIQNETVGTILTINFTTPGNVVLEGATLAEPSSVVIIIGYDAPTSPNDNTNIYKTLSYTVTANTSYSKDINIEMNKTYYVRFFVYTKENAINADSSSIYSINTQLYDPIFGNNSWEKIKKAIDTNKIPSTWNIGDEKEIEVIYKFNTLNITLQIWDFKNEGIGKIKSISDNSLSYDPNIHPKMVLGTKDIYLYSYGNDEGGSVYEGFYNMKDLRETLTGLYIALPSDLKSIMRSSLVKYNYRGGYDYEWTTGWYTFNFTGDASNFGLFPPSLRELNTESPYDWEESLCDTFGEQFPIFTDDNSRKKVNATRYNNKSVYWTRSVGTNLGSVYTIDNNGYADIGSSGAEFGIVFFLCL